MYVLYLIDAIECMLTHVDDIYLGVGEHMCGIQMVAREDSAGLCRNLGGYCVVKYALRVCAELDLPLEG